MKWISVKDRMPELGMQVLACDEEGGIDLAIFKKDKDTDRVYFHYCFCCSGLGGVDFWMPLPEAPE